MDDKKIEDYIKFLKDNSKNDKHDFNTKFTYKVCYDKFIEIKDSDNSEEVEEITKEKE